MNYKLLPVFLIFFLCTMLSCKDGTDQKNLISIDRTNILEEKKAILDVLNNETKAAFSRDYEGWKENWIHESYVSKTYMNFSDSTMTETLGWDEINEFVKTYIEDHPDPDPLPTMVNQIDVQLFGDGAWVSYEQNDAERGLKRETRLMKKVEGRWKIAGMHTSIYGFKDKE